MSSESFERLAPGQEREWEMMNALCPADPGQARILAGGMVYLDGRLDQGALMRALASVAARHEALRLTLESGTIDARVRIAPSIEPPVEYADWSRLSDEDQQGKLGHLAFRERRRRFDLRGGPLWKAHVVRLNSARHLLSFSFSHLIADGWSRRVFLVDLLAAYSQLLGASSRASEAAPTFDEISALQRARLVAAVPSAPSWLDRITERSSATPFTPAPAPDLDLLTTAQLEFSIPPATVSQLKRVAWKARATPFVILLTAYQLLLSLVTGRDRIVINTTTRGRPTRRERLAILQFTVDTYVPLDLEAGASLADLVQRTNATVAETADHPVSFQTLARRVKPDFDAHRPWPDCYLCDGNFNAMAAGGPSTEQLAAAGIVLRAAAIAASPAPGYTPDLSWDTLGDRERAAWAARSHPGVVIRTERDGGAVRYNAGLYAAETVQELLDRYLSIVEEMVWRPARTVRELRERFRPTRELVV
jgi:hypothetical protein